MRALEERDRLDQWLVAHGHAATREAARTAIMAGDVTVDGIVADKPGRRVQPGARVAVRRPERAFVGRGGLKLAHALAAFGIDPRGRTAVDLGASTGGFTDCLLQAGAERVYAVDVGRGQLAWRLRTDPRVVSLEGVNARHMTPAQVGGPRDLVTADLSFISLRLVWPAIAALVRPGGDAVALIKPQFEAGRAQVRRGGVVRDPAVHAAVLRRVVDAAAASGLAPVGVTASPLVGPAGNIEYLVHLRTAAHGRGDAPGAVDQRASRSGPRRRPRGTSAELDTPAPPASLDLAAVVEDAHARLMPATRVAVSRSEASAPTPSRPRSRPRDRSRARRRLRWRA